MPRSKSKTTEPAQDKPAKDEDGVGIDPEILGQIAALRPQVRENFGKIG